MRSRRLTSPRRLGRSPLDVSERKDEKPHPLGQERFNTMTGGVADFRQSSESARRGHRMVKLCVDCAKKDSNQRGADDL